jgi:hypothetical protein
VRLCDRASSLRKRLADCTTHAGGFNRTVEIVQLVEAGLGSRLPTPSTALTLNVWLPSASPTYTFGEPHAAYALPSSEQAKAEPASVAVKVKVASGEVGSGAAEVIVVSGGVRSTCHV